MICSLKENEFLRERITDVDYKDVDYKEIKQTKILSKRKVLILLISILLLIFENATQKDVQGGRLSCLDRKRSPVVAWDNKRFQSQERL